MVTPKHLYDCMDLSKSCVAVPPASTTIDPGRIAFADSRVVESMGSPLLGGRILFLLQLSVDKLCGLLSQNSTLVSFGTETNLFCLQEMTNFLFVAFVVILGRPRPSPLFHCDHFLCIVLTQIVSTHRLI